TPETLRHLGFRTLRQLAHPGNGVLDPEEQRRFDIALEELKRDTAALVDSSLQRSRRGGPGNLDPELRRTYSRTQPRLAEQARRAVLRRRRVGVGDRRGRGPAGGGGAARTLAGRRLDAGRGRPGRRRLRRRAGVPGQGLAPAALLPARWPLPAVGGLASLGTS